MEKDYWKKYNKRPKRREYLTEYANRWRKLNPQKIHEWRLKLNKKNRLEALKKYGGKCTCCGESKTEFLCLDHKNNDGALHRKNGIGTSGIVYWVRRNGYPDSIQILCWNCNMAKAIHKNCPHKI